MNSIPAACRNFGCTLHRHSRPRAPSSPAAPSKTPPFPPKRKPPPLALGPRAPGQPERTLPLPLGDGRSASRGNPRRHDLPLTVLQGWFDGWGSGEKPTAGDKGGSEGRRVKGGKRDDSSSKDNAAAPSSSSRLKRGGGRTVGDKKSSSAGRERSVSTGKSGVRGENKNGKGVGAEGGPKLQSLDAVRESLVDGAAAIQDRLSMTPSPQNVTFILGGGSLTNLTVPWRGIGVYVGGVVSGLAITVGLLTVPYADIGSPGLRKSLTLFENVLVDIDQVNTRKGSSRWGAQTSVGVLSNSTYILFLFFRICVGGVGVGVSWGGALPWGRRNKFFISARLLSA